MENLKFVVTSILISSFIFICSVHAKQKSTGSVVNVGETQAVVSRPPSSGGNPISMNVGESRSEVKVVRPPVYPSSSGHVVKVGKDEPRRAEKPKSGWNFSLNIGNSPAAVQRPVVVARPMPQTIVISGNRMAYSSVTLTPIGVSHKGDHIRLDDGSDWKVRHRHYKMAQRWRSGDVVLIETSSIFNWSSYKLVNHSRGETIDVELIEPKFPGTLSHWIAEIHPFDGYLRLQDGSIWQMSTAELLQWRVNDDVIIGLSKDWFSNQYSYTLINPRVKTRLVATLRVIN